MAIIEVHQLTKSYQSGNAASTEVLKGVTLSIEQAEFVSLMGASGSGKTTLLNLIAGLDTPDSGRVLIDNSEIHRMSENERSAFRLRRMGFIFQFFNLLPNLSVRDNIALPLLFLNQNEKKAHASAASIAERVGLGEKLSRMAHQLSGGEMQRVGIARALVHGPDILLADEPTGNLDSKTGQSILDLLRGVARESGVTVVMVTHDMHASGWCDRTIRMADGAIVDEPEAAAV